MKYHVDLVYNFEYAGYVADVPSLPGCMTQGKTLKEVMDNVKEAIDLYLDGLAPEELPYEH